MTSLIIQLPYYQYFQEVLNFKRYFISGDFRPCNININKFHKKNLTRTLQLRALFSGIPLNPATRCVEQFPTKKSIQTFLLCHRTLWCNFIEVQTLILKLQSECIWTTTTKTTTQTLSKHHTTQKKLYKKGLNANMFYPVCLAHAKTQLFSDYS